jgi:hypothetical protein
MVFVLTSFPLMQKGSNIERQPPSGVANFRWLFQYISVYFVKPSSG